MRFTGALVVLLIAVSVLGFGQTLSGSWEAAADFNFSGANWISLSSSLSVDYTVGEWTFSSSSDFGKAGWSSQSFAASGTLGDFTLSSSLDLNPSNATFKKWSTSASWDFEGLSLSASFDVAANYVASSFSASGEAGDLSLSLDVDFRSQGGCGLLFAGADISISLPFCCAEVDASFKFSCDGFEEAAFSVSDIAIPNLVWVTLDADLTFEMNEKTLELSPSFDFGDIACFDLYVDVETSGNLSIDSISIYGIGLKCDIDPISFEALSYLDGTHKLKSTYWEMYSLSFNDNGCCGPFSVEMAVYFLQGGARLFDFAYFEGSIEVDLSQQVSFDLGMTFDIEASVFEELALGFAVSW
ncbi:hypothetical protein KKG90_12985 [Candidatus Bipolaricaulota bacterium]|nr:hypothetical protein [Candidatus Bipolaricaulota bacterium]